jgi:excisionase family DNA binding protein
MSKTKDKEACSVYTARLLAIKWGCSERYIRSLVARGELRAFRLGGKLLRITAEAAKEFERRDVGGKT